MGSWIRIGFPIDEATRAQHRAAVVRPAHDTSDSYDPADPSDRGPHVDRVGIIAVDTDPGAGPGRWRSSSRARRGLTRELPGWPVFTQARTCARARLRASQHRPLAHLLMAMPVMRPPSREQPLHHLYGTRQQRACAVTPSWTPGVWGWRQGVRSVVECRERQRLLRAQRLHRAIPVDFGRTERASALDPVLVRESCDVLVVQARHEHRLFPFHGEQNLGNCACSFPARPVALQLAQQRGPADRPCTGLLDAPQPSVMRRA